VYLAAAIAFYGGIVGLALSYGQAQMNLQGSAAARAVKRLELARRVPVSSHVHPTTSRTQLRFVASGCRSRRQIRGTDVPLSTAFGWWQVQGSNLGRLSRRFYREPAARVRHGRSPVGLLRWCSLADLDVSPWLRAASLARLVARVTWGRADGRQDKGESEA